MNIMSLNIQGMCNPVKQKWVKRLCQKHSLNFISIQETKITRLDYFMLKSVWGNFSFDFACSLARGRSGGILCMWDTKNFVHTRLLTHVNYVMVQGKWLSNGLEVMIISVYAPQQNSEKRILWNTLKGIIDKWDAEYIVMGDFNEVRAASERFGSVFDYHGAEYFNDFIRESDLIDINMGGYRFTRTTSCASKMSKLDRFLVSQGMFSHWPHLSGVVLDRDLSDHRPILLKELDVDYGPYPFRFFHSWLEVEGFEDVVKNSWINDGIMDCNGMVALKKNFKL